MDLIRLRELQQDVRRLRDSLCGIEKRQSSSVDAVQLFASLDKPCTSLERDLVALRSASLQRFEAIEERVESIDAGDMELYLQVRELGKTLQPQPEGSRRAAHGSIM